MNVLAIYIYITLIQLIFFFLKKKQCYIAIQSKDNYYNTNKMQKGHKLLLEHFSRLYKKNYLLPEKKKIVLQRSNDIAMTIRDTSQYKKSCKQIHNPFNDIIQLDTKKQTVHVGAMITMGRLMNYLYPLGYALPVVPEFKCLTVGGLIAGAGLESSSFKHGLFPLCCLEYTFVLGNGEIKRITEETEPELFSAIPLSYGTLGTIADVVLRIIPIKRNVKIELIELTEYSKIEQNFTKVLQESKEYDFIEGIVYRKDKTIIICGKMVDTMVYPIIDPRMWYDPYFYQEIDTLTDLGIMDCTMNLYDYYFRHDRGAFWLCKYCLGDEKWKRAINPFINNASDKRYVPQSWMKKLLEYRQIEIQDAVVPLSKMQKMLTFAKENYDMYPIWLCPCKNVEATLQQKEIAFEQIKDQGVLKHVHFAKGKQNKILAKMKEFLSSGEKDQKTILAFVKEHGGYFDGEIKPGNDWKDQLLKGFKLRTSFLGILQSTSNEEYFMDVGLYGTVKHGGKDKLARLEKQTYADEGFMGQYAETTLSREDFEDNVLRKDWYQYLRKKYYAEEVFPDIYDKYGG